MACTVRACPRIEVLLILCCMLAVFLQVPTHICIHSVYARLLMSFERVVMPTELLSSPKFFFPDAGRRWIIYGQTPPLYVFLLLSLALIIMVDASVNKQRRARPRKAFPPPRIPRSTQPSPRRMSRQRRQTSPPRRRWARLALHLPPLKL